MSCDNDFEMFTIGLLVGFILWGIASLLFVCQIDKNSSVERMEFGKDSVIIYYESGRKTELSGTKRNAYERTEEDD